LSKDDEAEGIEGSEAAAMHARKNFLAFDRLG
jgi:hypothetical protein